MPENTDLPYLRQYLLNLENNNYSKETVDNYGRDLEIFAAFLHSKSILFANLDKLVISEFKGFLRNQNYIPILRKYKAGIVSITQNLADYGDEAFAKMLFTNSFTKIFLQNGASADYLKNTFDLPQSDIDRALSVTSKKPHYSEFFALTPTMSQVFRLYPTKEFYALANTENISQNQKKETE